MLMSAELKAIRNSKKLFKFFYLNYFRECSIKSVIYSEILFKNNIFENIIPKNKTNLTFSPFSLFSLFVSFGESVKIVRNFFGNGITMNNQKFKISIKINQIFS